MLNAHKALNRIIKLQQNKSFTGLDNTVSCQELYDIMHALIEPDQDDKYYFIYTTEEGGDFKGYRLDCSNLGEAKEFLNLCKTKGCIEVDGKGFPIHSIQLLEKSDLS